MPFIKFKPRHRLKGLHELLWAEECNYSRLPGGIFLVRERDLAMLDAKGIRYDLLGRGVLELNGRQPTSKANAKRQRTSAK